MSTSFILATAQTEVVKHPGISAAGVDLEKLKLTAQLDSEYLLNGEIKSSEYGALPISPAGIASPVLISRACHELSSIPVKVFDTKSTSASVETGFAIAREEVSELFERGQKFARDYIFQNPQTTKLILGECVVGGTTTAMGLLKALGYECEGMLSSSIPNGNHDLKIRLVNQGLKSALKREDFSLEKVQLDPLLAISAMGDPMQATVAGICLEALSGGLQVVLAGGSQMIAVASLLFQISFVEELGSGDLSFNNLQGSLFDNLSVCTTPWVAHDKSARTMDLANLVCPEVVVSCPGFDQYREHPDYPELFKAYDQGHVKEGVGAGALMSHCLEQGISEIELFRKVSELYEKEFSKAKELSSVN